MTSKTASNDKLELQIARFLRFGVLLSGALMAIGWLSFFDIKTNPLIAFTNYQAQPLANSLRAATAAADWGVLICYAGLFILISLPTLRVLLTALLFVRNRDYALGAIAVLVLFFLALSFSLGLEL